MALESTNSPLLSVIVPAYNEAGRISAPLNSLHTSLDVHFPREFELLVVDNGSTDNTAEIAANQGASVLQLPNPGKGLALRSGMTEAKGIGVRAFCDADGSIVPDDVLRLIDAVLENTVDIAIAERLKSSGQHDSISRLIGGRALGRLCEVILPTGIRDTQCGAKAFEAQAANDLFSQSVTNGWGIDREVLSRARKNGYCIATVPVNVIPMEGSHVKPVRDGIRMVKETARVRKAMRNDAKAKSAIISPVR